MKHTHTHTHSSHHVMPLVLAYIIINNHTVIYKSRPQIFFATTIPIFPFSPFFISPNPLLSLSLSQIPPPAGMSGADQEWVKAALMDDTMVVELLVRLHAAAPPPLKPAALPLEWSVRQRRSKPVSVANPKKQQSQRASPTTPLSWSGATSLSGGSGGSGGAAAGGSEESSRPPIQKLSAATRSKVNGDSEKTASKRSRKKKTLAELKDEETSLLKERRELKREIAALRVNLEKQRAANENLKRMKIELQPIHREITSTTEASMSDQLQRKTTPCHPISPIMPPLVSDNNVTVEPSSSNGCPEPSTDAASDSKFVLPDLNIPFGEDAPCPDVTCGVS